ncbi:permease YjgP/YjgQ family protein [Fischerella thermalis JSC-11]|jgi:lipopolysaccharide export system permease protein|uniref:Permease YjgP/YjgQ family protein n=2 Tax=Fischerella TaxID=1190 RepID=G6FS11_9CYAN|nr:permease YjgP/YjgQ family protein [Fischerella thermalis JSC-11]
MAKSKSFHNLSSLLSLSIMDRYLATELIPPFLFSFGIFASLVFTADSLYELLRKVVQAGLPLEIALKVFLLKLPRVIVYVFPMSTLLATLMTYSRLSAESELIALRSCGVSVYRMVLAAVVMSFLVAGITFVVSEQIAPAANYEASVTLDRALKSDKPTFKQENIFYPEYQNVKQPDGSKERILTRLFYADKFDGKRMKGLTLIDRSQEGLNQIVVAESGEWNGSQSVWDFYNGTIYLVAPDRSYRNIARFKHQQLQLPRTPLDVANRSRDFEEMNIAQSLEQLEIESISGNEQKVRQLRVRIQQKIAFPFACVVCGLVGATVGTIPQRTGRAASFGISLAVIFTYYTTLQVARTLGDTGFLSPFVAAWLPNFLGLALGLFLLVRTARR